MREALMSHHQSFGKNTDGAKLILAAVGKEAI